MSNQHLDTVKKRYPNAKTTTDTVNNLLDVIENKLGLKPNQLMHADSMCCDDVNAIQYPPRAYEILGPFDYIDLTTKERTSLMDEFYV